MNERIKELVKRSGGHFSTHNLMSNPVQHREFIELWDENIEKFAELIVRECAEVADNADAIRQKWEGIGKYVREHFGVE